MGICWLFWLLLHLGVQHSDQYISIGSYNSVACAGSFELACCHDRLFD
jgi:hypothetical protein